jgi:hypothetical protein
MAIHGGGENSLARLAARRSRGHSRRAQQPARLPTVGFLGSSTPSAMSQGAAAFVQRLRELGWIEGRTVAIEYRWADGRNEHYLVIGADSALYGALPEASRM